MNGVRSSRKLEREAQRNVELMWLMRKLRPDFKTIADFRRDNGAALRQVCRQFTLLCKKLNLFGLELIAVDGSKFRAANSKKRNFTRGELEDDIRGIDRRIEGYLEELDKSDDEEADIHTPTAEELREHIEKLKKKRVGRATLLEDLDRSGESQISLTDPDSRSMKSGTGTEVCYNVQAAVDEKHKLIVANDVINSPTDANGLAPIAQQAQEILGVEGLKAVADQGYSSGRGVRECVALGIVPYIPKPHTSANAGLGLFTKEDFTYDAENDCYICPANQRLTYRFQTVEKGREIRYYEASVCGKCTIKNQCTRNKGNRRITRLVDEHLLEEVQARVAASPELMKKRKAIVEHPFGTMKRSMNQGYFLMSRLENVKTEFSLTVLAYNLKRVLNLVSIPEMLAALA
jgi:hypothetical protein